MKLLFIQHAICERPGLLGEIAQERGAEVLSHLVEPNNEFPGLEGVSAIVSMGSVEAAYDETIPWIGEEYSFLEDALAQDIPILGVCFGGQLLARVLGGRAQRARESEFGWKEVQTQQPSLVPVGPWLVWHDDEFLLPSGADLIAETDVCAQAFGYGRNLGLQFHPEATPQIVSEWLDAASNRGQRLEPKHKAALSESESNRELSRKNAERLLDGFLNRAELVESKQEVEVLDVQGS